ncbi:MAG TPA: TonB family protein [Puia sp.]|nr:TonB family protein [Puia sp.]
MNTKKLLLLAIIGISCLPVMAQDTIYYNKNWEVTVADKAKYFRLKWREDKSWKVKDCYLSGKPQMEGAYIDDSCKIQMGTFSYYDEKGQLSHRCNYKDGEPDGPDMLYYDNGQIRTKGNYNKGYEVGEWLGYYPSGKPSAVAYFKKGKQVKGEFFNEDGTSNTTIADFNRECSFPGGLAALQRFLIRNLHYPDSAVIHEIVGTVKVGFNVSRDGKIDAIRIAQSVESSLDSEAIRVISIMPDWSPLIIGGIRCDSYEEQPINFVLRDSESAYIEE